VNKFLDPLRITLSLPVIDFAMVTPTLFFRIPGIVIPFLPSVASMISPLVFVMDFKHVGPICWCFGHGLVYTICRGSTQSPSVFFLFCSTGALRCCGFIPLTVTCCSFSPTCSFCPLTRKGSVSAFGKKSFFGRPDRFCVFYLPYVFLRFAGSQRSGVVPQLHLQSSRGCRCLLGP